MRDACGRSSADQKAVTKSGEDNLHLADYTAEVGKPVHLTDQTFEELIAKESKPVLVDLWAVWCGPCRMLAPTIDALAKQYKETAVVAKLDIDKNQKTPRKYQVRGIPTVLIFHKGKLVETLVGLKSKSDYADILNKLVAEDNARKI